MFSTSTTNNTTQQPPANRSIIQWVTGYLLLLGTIARLFPLFDLQHRLFWQYMTEDGYLLQTVARNLACGRGMTVSDGTIVTNGFQPLFTFLSAGLFMLTDGSKFRGIILVTLFSLLIAISSAWLVQKIARRASIGLSGSLAWLAAASWFAAPHIIRHSMNGLETGLYWLMMLMTLNYWLDITRPGAQPVNLNRRLALGVLLGFTFLARNDAVFFIAALLLTHVLIRPASRPFTASLTDAIIAGVTSIVIASPWLINNVMLFGSIVPISGKAESYGAHFAHNLSHIPATIVDSTLLYLPIPVHLESTLPVAAVCTLAILLFIAALRPLLRQQNVVAGQFFWLTLILLAEISAYYGLMFGATHFLQRYFSVLTPLLWLTWAAVLVRVVGPGWQASRAMAIPTLLIVAALASGFALRDYQRGYAMETAQEHENVVNWVTSHIPNNVWVGAIQSGTLGYFHDRTINLDGKVNPAALRALIQHGNILPYAEQSPVSYIADWSTPGFRSWLDPVLHPDFTRQFFLRYRNDHDNVMIMQRRSDAPAAPLTTSLGAAR